LTSGPDLLAWQSEPVHFTLELDVTLLNDNAGIMFAAQDVNNMFMWSINTYDETYPLLRRHVYINGNPTYEDIPIGSHFSKTDLIDVEHHLTIEVENQEIKTYIDDILIDTHTDNSGRLTNGYVGFRAYNGNNTDEVALYDNVVLTTYKPNNENVIEPVVTFSEDFEEGSNAFEGGETVEIAGNTKLKMYASSSDHRVIQGPMNGIPMFRKTFALDKEIKSAKIYSSSLGAYEMFVNGERVGTENEEGQMVYNELKPGWTDYTKTVQYNSHDITKLLAVGDNAIGAYVTPGWWKGDIAHGKYPNPELCFIAKAVIEYTDGTTTTIATDNSWLSSSSGPIRMAEIYDGITYDARKESNWNKPGYDDSGWFQTAISNRFQGQIIAFVGPHVQVRPEMRQLPESITIYEGSTDNGTTHGAINTVQTVTGNEEIQLNKDQTAVYDMSQNMVVWVKLTAKAAEGTKLTIRFGEMLNDDGSAARGNDGPAGSIYTANLRGARATIDYICKGDPLGETFEPMLTFFGFRYCEISTSEDVTIESFTGEVVGSVNEEGSSMATSNQRVNQLYQNVIWGQRCNFLSIPTDCPQRDERLGWTGDTQIFSRAATYNADVASFFHKWMGDMRDSQRDDGAFPSVAPHSWVGYGQGAWAEAGIIVPWNVYLMYGDTTIVSDNFEAMEKYMEFLANQAGGGYSYNGAGTDYGDWVAYEHTDKRYVSVCYYAYAAQLMEKMSAALSHQEGDAYAQKSTDYQTLYQNIKDEFQVRYVRTDGSLKQTSQTANLLALKLDLFPDEEARENAIAYLNQKIKNNGYKLSTGFVGTGILNQTLSETGSIGMAYNLLLQRGNPSWLYSVDQGATTIWERWDSYTIEDGFQDVGMNSFNHYAYGAVSEWMFRFMAGIEADETKPGFKHIILRPMPDFRINIPNDQERITSVDATYNSYYGPISSSWQQSEEREFTYSVEVPANTTATLYFPIKTDDDNPIFEGEQPAEEAEGVTLVKIEDGKAIFELGSGSYTFKSQIPLKDKAPQVFNGKYIINPNPVKNDLNIGTSPTKYIIKDVSGQELLCGYGVTADVSNLSRGIYLIQVDDEVQKFIKQ
jgi:alpha-L-rhamnosidase